jgi:hypothetical protein
MLTSAMKPTSLASTDWSRREFVRGIGFGMLGMGLTNLMLGQAQAKPLDARPAKAKHCIMIFLFGGPSQIDTWDMKPGAGAEYRGEFQPIATAVPGITCCEHLPRTARLAKHLAIIRSLTMTGRTIGDHHADTYYVLTGHQPDRSFFAEGINRKPQPGDWPCIGSTVASRSPPAPELPGLV